jgi:H+/Cl- antiporter ClcA
MKRWINHTGIIEVIMRGMSVISLISEIVTDAYTLVLQELQLAKHEFQEERRKTATAALALGSGLMLAVFGGLFILLMLVHLLKALTELPLWACYGAIGGLLIIAAMTLFVLGKKKVKQIQVVPTRTVETLKENVQWLKEIATSSRI